MQLKRLLLTPLLFAQMWVGAGALQVQSEVLESKSSIAIKLVPSEDSIVVKELENNNALNIYFLALLISVIFLGKKYVTRHLVTYKVQKEHVRQYFKNSFLNRCTSKSKNSYYWHFYSALGIVKSS